MMKTRSLYLTWYPNGTGLSGRRTDRITVANTRYYASSRA